MTATMVCAPQWRVRCDTANCGAQVFVDGLTLEDAMVHVRRLGWLADGGRIACRKHGAVGS